MDENEPLDKAAARELQEETSVNPSDVLLTQASSQSMMHALQHQPFCALSRINLLCKMQFCSSHPVHSMLRKLFARVLMRLLCRLGHLATRAGIPGAGVSLWPTQPLCHPPAWASKLQCAPLCLHVNICTASVLHLDSRESFQCLQSSLLLV